jgi:DNA-binding NarL/FixJ family response regulator
LRKQDINVAITDDHPLALNGIRSMLRSAPHIHVSATYSNGEDLLTGLKASIPDVLLLDIMLPDISGKDLARIVSIQYPQLGVIALASLDAPSVVKSMIQRGCKGYLLKDADEHALVAAIEAVAAGEEFVEPSLKEHLFQHWCG